MTLLLLLACATTGPSGKDADPATDDSGPAGDDTSSTDSGDAADEVPFEIDAFVAPDVSTVVVVRWKTAVPTAGHVEFGEDTGYRLTTPSTAVGTEHEVLLLGLYADTEFHFRVVSDTASGPTSEDLTITTGSLPAGLLPVAATGQATDWSGYQVLPLQGTSYAVVIIDAWGRYVWYHMIDGTTGGNLMRAFLSVDGQSVIYMLAGPQNDLALGKVVRVSLDGSKVEETATPFGDHDMVELPDGTLTAIVVTDGTDGGSADSIVEFGPDGSQRTIFNAWDHWDPYDLGVSVEHNWTHANAIDYDPDEDCYYLSMKQLESLAKIDRSTGEVLWTMNGMLNQFTFSDGGHGLEMNHQFELQDDGNFLFFENGHPERGYSRAVELEVDQDALTAEYVWEYIRDPWIYVFAKGDVHRFDNGNTEVVWSTAGEIQNVTPDGEVTWQLNLDLGTAVTFVQVVDSMYGGG